LNSSTSSLGSLETSVSQAVIYPSSQHAVLQKNISVHALKVLKQLQNSGYEAYLVGGCVRDLLLDLKPKDFDVVTNAHPDEIKQVFKQCRLIGRRFRLAHVYFGREIIEVATFRGVSSEATVHQTTHADGRLLRDNVYGSIEEDVWRRDFTVNALYYDAEKAVIVDYAAGMEDYHARSLKLIGDPVTRYREDPVRMLRAVRFAAKLKFTLHPDTATPLHDLGNLLVSIPSARLYDEVLKLFLSGYALSTFKQLRQYNLFQYLFPEMDQHLNLADVNFPKSFLLQALENSDARIREGKSVTLYFLMSAFFWEALQVRVINQLQAGETEYNAYQIAANEVLTKQVKVLSIPRRITQSMREVWILQLRFPHCVGSKPYRLLAHPRFRAAYDFLLLLAEAGLADAKLAIWWTEFQVANADTKQQMTQPKNKSKRRKKPKKINNSVSKDNL